MCVPSGNQAHPGRLSSGMLPRRVRRERVGVRAIGLATRLLWRTRGEWMRCLVLFWALGVGVIVGAARAENAPDRAGIEFFETSIRPLLAENCWQCHGEKKQKGELRLDSHAAVTRGG